MNVPKIQWKLNLVPQIQFHPWTWPNTNLKKIPSNRTANLSIHINIMRQTWTVEYYKKGEKNAHKMKKRSSRYHQVENEQHVQWRPPALLLGREAWRRRRRSELLRRLGAASVPAEQVAHDRQEDQQEDRWDGYHNLKHGCRNLLQSPDPSSLLS